MTDPGKQKLVLIDGSAYFYRAFFAIRHLSAPDGQPTNAVYGFVAMLLKVLDDLQPTHLAVVFDSPAETHREKLYPDYKRHRPAMPEDLVSQIPLIHQIVEAYNFASIEMAGFEADDIIATLSKAAQAKGMKVFIVSGDKDMMQLVSDSVVMVDTMKGKVIGVNEVVEKFGVGPERVIDVLALVGDSVDNVPGVPGVGEKTARELIAKFGTLDRVLENAAGIEKPRLRESLVQNAHLARLSRELVTLCADVPLSIKIDDLRLKAPDVPKLVALFRRLGFRKFLDRLTGIEPPREGGESSLAKGASTPSVSPTSPPAPSLLSHTAPVVQERSASVEEGGEDATPPRMTSFTPESLPAQDIVSYDDYHLVLTAEDLQVLMDELGAAERFSFDLETTGTDPITAEIVGISFATRPHRAFYCPFKHSYIGAPEQLSRERTLALFKPLLEDPKKKKVGQNLKYDIAVLRKYGIAVRGVVCDVMLASYLLDPGRRAHGLATLSLQHLGHRMISYEEVTGKGKKQRPFSEVDVQTAMIYSCEDADVAFILAEKLVAKLADAPSAGMAFTAASGTLDDSDKTTTLAPLTPAPLPEGEGKPARTHGLLKLTPERSEKRSSLLELLEKLELPLLHVLVDMELAGVRIDIGVFAELSAELKRKAEQLRRKIVELAGVDFNLDSPRQLQEVLFERLALKRGRKTKTGYSTDIGELERLAGEYPIARLLVEYRSATKLNNTYCEVLPRLVNPRTGRVHTSFNQAATATGRLSSSDPNLQNIPIRTEEGKKIRRGFVPGDGCVFISGDYSQVELRVLAHLAEDERLIDAFRRGEDIHARTAAEVFGVAPAEVSEEMRRHAKAINFGIIYGMSAHGLAAQLGVPHGEAQRYIDTYFDRYAGVRRFLDSTLAAAETCGYVTTLLGRVRPVPEIHSATAQVRAAAERIVRNTPIQGTAADLMKLAMVNLHARLRREGLRSRMILQVHDELLLEVPLEERAVAIRAIREEMENALPLKVPIKVDLAEGKSWGEMVSL